MIRRKFLQHAVGASLLAGADLLRAQTPTTTKPPAVEHGLSGVDSSGRRIGLGDFKGKAILISFFTSGCNLCLYDLKLMREFNRNNRGKNFAMLGVSLDEQKNDYQDYAKWIELSVPPAERFPLLWRKAPEHQDTFGSIAQMPTHFALNQSNQLAFTRKGFFRPEDWDDLWLLFSS